MYFAVMKLGFDEEHREIRDLKTMKSISEKVRSRFKVNVLCSNSPSAAFEIVISALSLREEKLNNLLDTIEDFLENEGIGRITSESTLMDHVDNIEEFEQDG